MNYISFLILDNITFKYLLFNLINIIFLRSIYQLQSVVDIIIYHILSTLLNILLLMN